MKSMRQSIFYNKILLIKKNTYQKKKKFTIRPKHLNAF